MSTRTALAEHLLPDAPPTWDIYPYPVDLGPLDDPAKPVAIVIEQRALTASVYSPTEAGIPVGVGLAVWVVVDGSLGDAAEVIEDRLEEAAERMIDLLEPLRTTNWDGTAQRSHYDPQKPAYSFPITASGALTRSEAR